ncbi:MAG: PAS domain-containing protein [candidate division KSB1 bacterium]|nr:PAS domain-containing protein [candidate division KSB1 bacterium]
MPNAAYVQAMKQMLLSNDRDYSVGAALTLSELVEHVSYNQYDLVLVDSELARDNKNTFFKVLSTIKHESRIAFSVKKDETDMQQTAKDYGISDLIEKKKGYLVTLNEFVKNTERQPQSQSKSSPTSDTQSVKKLSKKGDFFVCDKYGRFLAVNKQLEQLLKYSREELFEFRITDLLDDQDEASFIRDIIALPRANSQKTRRLTMLDKTGKRYHVHVRFRLLYDGADGSRFIGFRGVLKARDKTAGALTRKHKVDQRVMTNELVDLVQTSYSEPLNIFLQRISEVVCQVFKFQRSTIALLDHRKQSYIKQVMVGYSKSGASLQKQTTVPRDAVDRLFESHKRIKTIHHQKSLSAPGAAREKNVPWHYKDMVLMRLSDSNKITYGYISLDTPKEGLVPTEETFHNMELFSQLVSMSIENYYRFNALERKNRCLRQLFASNNVFKLQSSLDDLLKETVWSSKQILDFNLVSLALISKKTQMLETRAVACDDRIKQVQLQDMCFDLDQFGDILKEEYVIGKSFIVNRREAILHHFKKIYYGADANSGYEGEWPNWALLLIPIKSQEGKIIGFFMADDPVDHRMPTVETIQLLEILASQIAIAIDNRVMYVQAKGGGQSPRHPSLNISQHTIHNRNSAH